ncbi:Bacterio-opsin activator HTH domain protein [Ferroglobus placidus DSM 10642]|uniref:Bacterio-opsin activator HTH domain protein n=1 Tax=Ferroglobus placidus (strain DSM 10642 / AEDII12DO) TaxID=589924 RepID=D3S111_FERPA|nr:helix-turn-helix domain-containing protein [Ferroglobus placidus]ADC64247.1 Bacterio-opsin activator HTH domain protein [Ferroglobus placidus DSM 10642]
MIEVQIKTPAPPDCQLSIVRRVLDEAIVKVEKVSTFNEELRSLIDLKARNVEKILSELPATCVFSPVAKDEVKILFKGHTCHVALTILKSGCLISSAVLEKDNVTWNIICDEDSFIKLSRELEKEGVEFEIVYKGRFGEKDKVTLREEEILKIALEKGYFDFPKKIKLEELASQLNIAPSTLSEILRRGQKKVLEKYFSGN